MKMRMIGDKNRSNFVERFVSADIELTERRPVGRNEEPYALTVTMKRSDIPEWRAKIKGFQKYDKVGLRSSGNLAIANQAARIVANTQGGWVGGKLGSQARLPFELYLHPWRKAEMGYFRSYELWSDGIKHDMLY